MLKLLDFFFIGFHTILILFNLFGWAFAKTRMLNLIVLILTGSSWFLLGIFYGMGYCPLTDWHFMVLQEIGENNLPTSYITYILHRFSGIWFNAITIDRLTMILYIVALILSVISNRKRLLGYIRLLGC